MSYYEYQETFNYTPDGSNLDCLACLHDGQACAIHEAPRCPPIVCVDCYDSGVVYRHNGEMTCPCITGDWVDNNPDNFMPAGYDWPF